MDLFYNFWWLSRTATINTRVKGIRDDVNLVDQRLDDLVSSHERLLLLCQAMWELLREREGLTELQLADKLREIDLRDGMEDGKVSPVKVATCEHCRRPINRRHRKCIYCGAANPHDSAFETT